MSRDPVLAALHAHWSARWWRKVAFVAGWLDLVGLGSVCGPVLDWLARRQSAFLWPLLERAALEKARGVAPGAAVATTGMEGAHV